MNKGAQGGNFNNCDLNHPTFNIKSPNVRSLIQNYQKIRFIVNGSFGEVWIVKPKNVHASQEFIMKEIPCTEENVKTGRNEINILKNCRDEIIVSFMRTVKFSTQYTQQLSLPSGDQGHLRQTH